MFIIFFSTFYTQSVKADVTRNEANRWCQRFIEKPDEFVPVQTNKCSIKAFEDANTLRDGKCFSFSPSQGQKARDYGLVYSSGTCRSEYLTEISNINVAKPIQITNSTVNGYSFGSHEKAFTFEDRLFVSNGQDLRHVGDDGQTVLCTFMYEHALEEPLPSENSICNKLNTEEYSSNISDEEQGDFPVLPEGNFLASYRADLDLDGKEEDILSYNYASGAGCGCDANPLFLSNKGELVADHRGQKLYKMPIDPQDEKLGIKLNSLTFNCKPHFRTWSIIKADNKDYILAGFRDERIKKKTTFPYISKPLPDRELFTYHQENFKKVCVQKAKNKKFIAHEVIKEENWRAALNYLPLE